MQEEKRTYEHLLNNLAEQIYIIELSVSENLESILKILDCHNNELKKITEEISALKKINFLETKND